MNKLVVSSNSINFNGESIKQIYGGFGSGQISILAKQVALLHGYEVREINQLIENSLDWFEEGIDFIDLKVNEYKGESVVISNDHGLVPYFYTQEGFNRSEHIYLLSQQGYALLCKLMKGDLSKQVYKQVIRKYFSLEEKKTSGPKYIERAFSNLRNIPYGYFGVIDETTITLYKEAELAGYIIPDKSIKDIEMRIDVSLGRFWHKYYLEQGFPESEIKTYTHVFKNGIKVKANCYLDKYLGDFRKFVVEIWLSEEGPRYFYERCPEILKYLPKMFPTCPSYSTLLIETKKYTEKLEVKQRKLIKRV